LGAIDAVLPHIILTDIAMPLEDGYELLRRLRLRPAEDGGSIPVVALSAYSGNDERQRSAAAGFAAHLTKPIDASDLITAIVSAVAGRSPRASPPWAA
jgi:CheY-like chemotaxis protein